VLSVQAALARHYAIGDTWSQRERRMLPRQNRKSRIDRTEQHGSLRPQ